MRWTALGIALASLLAPPCPAQPDHGFDWVTIGDPGNRDVTPDEAPMFFPPFSEPFEVGGVDHVYRITRTEVTVSQHLEFVSAYAPYWDGFPDDPHFIGFFIQYDAAEDRYFIPQGFEDVPTEMSWHIAARLVNWLHNDKAKEQWAFENGSYDTSTFGKNDDGTWNDQPAHHPDAKFWIPTIDEWIKGMHWDPGKDGQGGYWKYPHSSDEPPIPGWPWEGGETSAGIVEEPGDPYLPVGSYPHVQSPWGLLDGSGGVREWTETFAVDRRARFKNGTAQYQPFHEHFDRLDVVGGNPPNGIDGVRLASVPSPAAPALLVCIAFTARRRSHQ
ncbi:MAG: SUMF1/EgtB/PvdO family nonheme iron enzyme [Phycisphaeraceae bacterium]|nr:SUMF1/EgtB/PvdO family nonheme iron enzyme [Phycisphaeraceae bacterium]